MDDLDHRNLGVQLKLWHLQDDAPGMVFWHPRGYAVYRVLEDYVRRKMRRAGPHPAAVAAGALAAQRPLGQIWRAHVPGRKRPVCGSCVQDGRLASRALAQRSRSSGRYREDNCQAETLTAFSGDSRITYPRPQTVSM
jgi:hypothetical protein